MKNLYKAYYQDYFSNVDFSPLLEKDDSKITEGINNKIFLANNLLKVMPTPLESGCIKTFTLKIAYPGLVTGVGIDHEAKVEGEFKLGVHFDYTWGMPVVYGSSVKGVLRCYFMDFIKGFSDNYSDVQALKDDIFGKEKDDKSESVDKSIYQRDIFFDAVLTKPDSKGRILCSDSITQHPHPLKNPVPITFLKIAPGCTMEFRFRLVDSVVNGHTFTADDKLKLFKEILLTVGVGAKTNVGYGQFSDPATK